MATLTAQILVGSKHRFHDGINPTHSLFLSENDRPAWLLVRQDIHGMNRKNLRKGRVVWIPTLENMLEDALLMIGIHICKDTELNELAKKFFPGIEANRVELYTDLEDSQRKQLYQKCREITRFPKVIVTTFKSSAIGGQLSVLNEYKMEFEICTHTYSRLYSCWPPFEAKIAGSLP